MKDWWQLVMKSSTLKCPSEEHLFFLNIPVLSCQIHLEWMYLSKWECRLNEGYQFYEDRTYCQKMEGRFLILKVLYFNKLPWTTRIASFYKLSTNYNSANPYYNEVLRWPLIFKILVFSSHCFFIRDFKNIFLGSWMS